jgi:hypothetical protein
LTFAVFNAQLANAIQLDRWLATNQIDQAVCIEGRQKMEEE